MRGTMKVGIVVAGVALAAAWMWLSGPEQVKNPSGPPSLTVWQVPADKALSYRFEHRHSSTLALPLGGDSRQGAIEADIVLQLDFELTRHASDTLGLRLVAMPEHRMQVAGQDTLPDAGVAEMLGMRAEIPVDAQGRFGGLVFERGAPLSFRRLIQLVATEMQVRLPKASVPRWTADEVTTNGTAVSAYEVMSADHGVAILDRTRSKYRSLQALVGRSEMREWVSGTAKIKLDGGGQVLGLSGSDSIEATDAQGGQILRLEAKTELLRLGERSASSSPRIADGTRQALDAPVISEDFDQRRIEKRAKGMPRARLLEEISVLAPLGKLPSHKQWFSSAVARVQAEPDIARALIPIYHGRNTRAGREILLDTLVWAGHDEAQAVLVELIDSETTRNDPQVAGFVQRISFVPAPNAATLTYAEKQAFSGTGRFETSALYALGSAASNARKQTNAESNALGAAIVGRLAAALEAEQDPERQRHLISSLGNADAHEHEGLLVGYASSVHPMVRSHVASSLRSNRSPLARATLMRLSTDTTPQVQRRALAVLQKHEGLTDADLSSIAEAVRGARIAELSLPLVVNVVAPYTRKTAAAAMVLQRVIERPLKIDPSIQWRAQNLLNHPLTLR